MTISNWYMFSLKGWQPFAERSAAKGWLANASTIPFGCAEKAATHTQSILVQYMALLRAWNLFPKEES